MGFKETAHSNSVFSWSRVCCSNKCCMSSCLDEESIKRIVTEPSRTDNHLLWQKFSHSIIKQSCVPQENQAHRHKLSFHKRVGEQQGNLFGIFQVWRSTCKHLYKTIGKRYISVSLKLFMNEKFCTVNFVMNRACFLLWKHFVIFCFLNYDLLIIMGECWKY